MRLIPRAALLRVAVGLLAAGCGLDAPMTTVLPKSDLGRAIHDLFMNISGWALLIFVVVEALLIGVVFAFRLMPGSGLAIQHREPVVRHCKT